MSIFEKSTNTRGSVFLSPMSGELRDLKKCEDPIFAEEIIGKGVLIIPDEPAVFAPCPGLVTMVAEGEHAIAIKNSAGLQILVHVGIDTVELEGEGFKALVKEGDKVFPGDKLIEFDMDLLKNKGKSLESPVLITTPNIGRIDILGPGHVKVGDELIGV